jgi:hypothetical protein
MKITYQCRPYLLLLGIIVSISVIACTLIMPATGRVALVLSPGVGARTILPTVTVASYRISFSGPVGKAPVVTTDSNPTIDLEVGTWDISVEGRDSGGDTVAVGSASDVVVTAGATTPVSIELSAQSAGNGTIDVTVTWPGSVTPAIETLEVTVDGAAVNPSTLTSGGSPPTWVRYVEGKASGSYQLCFLLKSGTVLRASVQEAVQVYDNLDSSATIALTEGDFTAVPAAPSGLVVAEGLGRLVLSWVDNSHVETGYTIERGPDGSTWGVIASISAPATSYDDTTAAMGQTYYYQVKATNNLGASDPSGSASGMVKAPVSGGAGVLTFSDVTSSSIRVSWQKAVDNVSAQTALQYKVVRSLSDNVQTVVDAEANGTLVQNWTTDIATASATGLIAGTTYYFNVLARDEANNESAYASNLKMTLDGTGSISITITVTSPQNETITFSQVEDIVVAAGSTLLVAISEGFDSYEWMLDGAILPGQTSATVNFDCTPLTIGVHHLTAFVEKSGLLYSKTLRFRIEN